MDQELQTEVLAGGEHCCMCRAAVSV